MTDYKLKGMGCEFDDLISDTAKVSVTTGNSMSERQAARGEMPEHYRTEKNGMTVSPACVSDVCMWFSKHYHTIRAALQTHPSLSDECIHECRVMIKEKTGLEAAFFDDLISDTAKVSVTTGNSMSERQAAMESAQWLDDCAEGMEEEGLDRENNARHFRTGAKYIRAALSSPAVPVIDGLDEAIKNMYATFDWHGELNDRAKVLEAARTYAALMKGEAK